MRYSSARQLELDYTSGATSDTGSVNGSTGDTRAAPTGYESVSTDPINLPDFARYDAAFAAASKAAGRINAASISDAELGELLRERKRLLMKRLDGKITPRESNRLQYVRWTLDRIEDARDGYILEALEDSVARYEQLAEDLTELYSQLETKLPSKKAR